MFVWPSSEEIGAGTSEMLGEQCGCGETECVASVVQGKDAVTMRGYGD